MKKLLLLALLVLPLTSMANQPLGGTHDITKISDDIYVAMPKFGGANATFIINQKGVVVVDPHSSPADANALIAQIKALTDKPVTTVINTHRHGDHHGGNKAFYIAYPDVKIIAHHHTRQEIVTEATAELRRYSSFYSTFYQKAEKYLAKGIQDNGDALTQAQKQVISDYIKAQKAFVKSIPQFEYALPNITINQSLTLHHGQREIKLLHLGKGHTRGDLAVYLPKDKLLIAGDLLTSPYIVVRSGYPEQNAKVLNQLAQLSFEQLVVGHGGPVKQGNAFIRLMAEFSDKLAQFAKQSLKQQHSFEQALAAALADPSIKSFNQKINWKEPKGLKMLTFERLIQMTLSQAYKEAQGQLP